MGRGCQIRFRKLGCAFPVHNGVGVPPGLKTRTSIEKAHIIGLRVEFKGAFVQFERLGYFAHDPREPLLFNRTVGLRDEWANIQKRKA